MNCSFNKGTPGCLLVEYDGPRAQQEFVDSVISHNQVTTSWACGSALYITDPFTRVTMKSTKMEQNIGPMGVICVRDSSSCLGGTVLEMQNSSFVNKNDTLGLFFLEAPSVCQTPQFKTSGDTTQNNTGVYQFSIPSGITVSPPITLSLPTDNSSVISFQTTVKFVDLWSVQSLPSFCSTFVSCFNTTPPLFPANTTDYSTVIRCTNSSSVTLDFEIPIEYLLANTPPDVSQVSNLINFGPAYCPPLQPGEVAIQKYARINVTINLPVLPVANPTDPTDQSGGLPPLAVALIASGSALLLAAGVVALVLYIRKERGRYRRYRPQHRFHTMQEPLIAEDGVLMTDIVSRTLAEANVPLVEPDDLEIITTIGQGATGVVAVAKVRTTCRPLLGITKLTFLPQWHSSNDMLVAVKQMSTANIIDKGWSETRKDQIRELVTEVSIMIQVSHPNLLPLLVRTASPTQVTSY